MGAQHAMHEGKREDPGFSPGPLAYDASCAPGVLAPLGVPAAATPSIPGAGGPWLQHTMEHPQGGGCYFPSYNTQFSSPPAVHGQVVTPRPTHACPSFTTFHTLSALSSAPR